MKKIILLLGLATLPIFFVTLLYFFAKRDAANGFIRKKGITLKSLNVLDIGYNSYYISNLSQFGLFLGNSQAPLHVLRISTDLKDTLSVRLPFKYHQDVNWTAALIQLDLPNVYLIERKTPAILVSSFDKGLENKPSMQQHKFDLIKMITPRSAVIRYYDPFTKQKVLQKISVNEKIRKLTLFKPLKKQDGDFAMDGFLSYNEKEGKLLYTYYYINKFICLDTNMNYLYTANTIDTNTVAKIKISETRKGELKSSAMSKPPLYVNKRGYTAGKWLYINSGLISDNENKPKFNQYAVIDMYSISDGSYQSSIYLRHFKNKKIRDFAVYKNLLFALYDHYLVTYQLPEPLGSTSVVQ